MRVIDLMELATPGFTEGDMAIEWIKEGLFKLNQEYPQAVQGETISLVKGQRYYPLPSTMLTLIRVLQYVGYDNPQSKKVYAPIPAVNNTKFVREEV